MVSRDRAAQTKAMLRKIGRLELLNRCILVHGMPGIHVLVVFNIICLSWYKDKNLNLGLMR